MFQWEHMTENRYANSDTCEKRDSGLQGQWVSCFEKGMWTTMWKIKKNIQAIFHKYEFKIPIKCNQKVVGYLYVPLRFSDTTFRSFFNTDNKNAYIHKESNHTPSIIRHMLLSIETRLRKLLPNEKVFD